MTATLVVASFLIFISPSLASFHPTAYHFTISLPHRAVVNPSLGTIPATPILWAIFVSGFCSTLLFAYIFDKWANVCSFAGGAMAGALIGFLIMLSFDLSFHAFFNLYSPSMLAVDVVVGTVFNAFIGGVIGIVLGTGKKD